MGNSDEKSLLGRGYAKMTVSHRKRSLLDDGDGGSSRWKPFFKGLAVLLALYGALRFWSPSSSSETMSSLKTIFTSSGLVALLSLAAPSTPIDTSVSKPDWAKYVRSPASRTVLPVAIIANYTQGNVTNPTGLLGGVGVTTFNREKISTSYPSWPKGTTANASSYHSAGSGRTYGPANSIDGDLGSFWNDDSLASYPDILTITSPAAVKLPGITILSNKDGVPVNLLVEILDSNLWVQVATVKRNSEIQLQVPFTQSVSTAGVRITVTKAEETSSGEYTRINEVWPGLVPKPAPAPAVVVDFGQVVGGFLSISFAGASKHSPGIRLAFSETTSYLTDVSDFSRSYNGDTITPGSDQIAVSSDPYVWTDTHGCVKDKKVCADGLHGFRYVKIYLDALDADAPLTVPYGEVSIDAISLDFTPYLGTENTFNGWFECSDETLTQYWYDGVYTNDLCIDTFRKNDTEPRDAASSSLIGKLVLHDGVKRDRDPYLGDLAVAARTAYVTHNVSISAKNVLADLADHQRSDGWIPPASIGGYSLHLYDYPLWWVVCSFDYLLYTGDASYATAYYSNLLLVLDTYYPSTTDQYTGLLNKGKGNSEGYGDYAFLPRSGIITYYNALYVLALKNAAQWARTYGKASDAERWETRAILVGAGVNKFLWDPAVGAFFDNLNSTTHAQDGNSIAILAGITSSARSASILNYWSSLALPYGNPFFSDSQLDPSFSTRVYAFISYFEISARFESGLADTAIDEMERLFGWMSTHDPKITFWEGIGKDGSMYEGPYTSASHGWSTGNVPAMTNYVLGITPTGFGFVDWTLKPIPSKSIKWARGQVMTPKGAFTADWTTESYTCQFVLSFDAPEGTKGIVSVPVKRQSVVVLVDGLPVFTCGQSLLYGARYGNGYVSVDLEGGNHVVSVTK